jgi:hypothetical protein
MPTFKIANTTRIQARALAAAGDVDGNTYRNLLYAEQMTYTADEDNLGSVFVGDAHVSTTSHDAELHASDSVNKQELAGVDDYIVIDKVLAAPGAPTAATGGAGTNLLTAGNYKWKVTFVTADGETEAGTASNQITVDPAAQLPPALSSVPTDATAGVTVTSRKIYRTEAGGTVYKLSGSIANNSGTTYTDNIPDASLGAAAPSTNSAVPMKVNMMWKSPFPIELT